MKHTGRTGMGGNKEGKGCEMHIRMKDPYAHLKGKMPKKNPKKNK